MLITNGTEIHATGYRSPDKSWDVNYSAILTKLIQEAGKVCQHYASDLFIFWESLVKELKSGEITASKRVFAMYESGIDGESSYLRGVNEYLQVWILYIATDDRNIELTLQKKL